MHPYKNLNKSSYWSKSINAVDYNLFNPIVNPKFKISDSNVKIATAGSCFAQYISKYLNSCGINPYVVEDASMTTQNFKSKYQYGLFSARYGNIYSSTQLKQLFDRAFGNFTPLENFWIGNTCPFIDPFRQSITNGFQTIQELILDQNRHLSLVKDMFQELDVFIFTLGLTEVWKSKVDGSVYPSAPGVLGGTFDSEKYEFYNLSVSDVFNDLKYFSLELKNVNSNAKILLTVSPVPLVATATNNHVLSASIYSKSVLRVAAQMVVDEFDFVDYFPSYEIITGPQSILSGGFYEEDLRNIKAEGVDFVMDIFMRNYLDVNSGSKSIIVSDDTTYFKKIIGDMNIICEEVYNDAYLDNGNV
jgi:hypothetical protein